MDAQAVDTFFKWLEIIGFFGGIGGAIYCFGRMTSKFEQIAGQNSKEIGELRVDVKRLSEVTIKLAEQSGRIDRVEDRQLAQGKRLDEVTKRFDAAIDGRLPA